MQHHRDLHPAGYSTFLHQHVIAVNIPCTHRLFKTKFYRSVCFTSHQQKRLKGSHKASNTPSPALLNALQLSGLSPLSHPSYTDIYSDQCYIFRPMLNLLLTQASAPRLVAYHLWFVLCSTEACWPFCGCYSPKGDSPGPKAPVPLFSGGEQG